MVYTIYFRDEIAGNLAAVGVGMLSSAAAHGATNVQYCRGVLDTLRAQALCYRIPWIALESELRAGLKARSCEELLELLEQVGAVQQPCNLGRG